MNKFVMVVMELMLACIVWKVSTALFCTPISAIIHFVETSKTAVFKCKSRKTQETVSTYLCKLVLIGNVAFFFLIMNTPFIKAAFQFINNYFG